MSVFAAAARSVLSCPDDVRLVVDGVDDITEGLGTTADGDGLSMHDVDGTPALGCPLGSALADAAGERRRALLTLTSGLGRPGSPERDATLTLTGPLEIDRLEECECCGDLRATVLLRPSYVVIARTLPDGEDVRHRVPVAAFADPALRLNRGFLQRSAEHANGWHQDELRRAVATLTETRPGDVVAVQLADLRTDRVELRWVDPSGAHTRQVRFDAPAASPRELGEALRRQLHAGLC